MKYCSCGEKAEKLIQGYVDTIVKEIVKNIPNTKSIILSGGFGRGEGSVEVKGERIIPLNDFDIYIITEKEVEEEKLNNISNEIAKKLHIKNYGNPFYILDLEKCSNSFYLDFKSITLDKLKTLPPLIRFFELKYASNVIYGEDYRPLMPPYKPEDIPRMEGFRILLNRMDHLATLFRTGFFKGKFTENKLRGHIFFTTKAFLAVCDALLLLNNKFKPSYLERYEEIEKCFKADFPELYKKLPHFIEDAKLATDFKLKTDFNKIKDPIQYWENARKTILEVTEYFVGKLLNTKIKDVYALSDAIYKRMWVKYFGPYLKFYFKKKYKLNLNEWVLGFLAQRYLNLGYFYRLKKFRKITYPRTLLNRRSPDLTIYSTIPLLLYSLHKNYVDEKMLNKAIKMFKKTFPINKDELSAQELWDYTSQQLGDAYVLFFFWKLI